jgi:5'-nucleotidase
MEILLTNDDGINSPALVKLAKELNKYGNVTVVAPDRDSSGKGASITLRDVLRFNKIDFGNNMDFYAVEGTPADSVIMARKEIADKPFDLVVSGINYGANIGADVFISGTVGAAIHGYLGGTLSIALSIASLDAVQTDITEAVKYSGIICKFISDNKISKPEVININFPNIERSKFNGAKNTFIGPRIEDEVLIKETRTRGDYYFLRLDLKEEANYPEESDMEAIKKGYISVSKLDTNMNPGGYDVKSNLSAQITEYINKNI